MSKAPYRHSDGSDCYTKNCSRGHVGTGVANALSNLDVNAFLDAKQAEATVQSKSLEELGFTPRVTVEATQPVKQVSKTRKVLRTLGMAAGAAGIAVMLSACAPSSLNTGTIDAKDHREAYTSISQMCGGKPMTCHPVTTRHPEQWNITIEGYNANGDMETRTLNVGETIYNDVAVGQDYKLTQEQMSAAETDAAWGNGLLAAGGVAGAGVLGTIAYVQIKRKREDAAFEQRWGHKRY